VPGEPVHPTLVEAALDQVSGSAFEDFVNAFYPAISGFEYVPLGGNKDGGADGFQDEPVHEESAHPNRFLQASIQREFKSKIRHTVSRLREVGRTPTTLVYVTSIVVPLIDVHEQDLTEVLGVAIRIRDGKYIASQINTSYQTRAAFDIHLRHFTDYLKAFGKSQLIRSSKFVRSPTVYVFLRQEVERRSGDTTLPDAVVDGLVIYSLEGTDPDKGILLDRQQITAAIAGDIPTATTFVEAALDRRLEYLSSKARPEGRAIRWHQKEDKFCLPYDTRKVIESENLEDEELRIAVLDSLRSRIAAADPGMDDSLQLAADLALRAIQLTYERNGLEFSYFLASGDRQEEPRTVTDALAQAFEESAVPGDQRPRLGSVILSALRGAFYSSIEEERLLFSKLSRTYALLFTLNTDPQLVEYFEEMAADFYLYVGTDELIRAMSERYVPEADQMTRNTLRMSAEAGATLVLAQPVLEEVVNHLRSTDQEFRNLYGILEPTVTLPIAQSANKILLRAFFYAKLNMELGNKRPTSWSEYVGQFCNYLDLHKAEGVGQVKAYLESQFQLRFESTEDLEEMVDPDELHALATSLSEDKQNLDLARNDALMALAVYGRRKELGETQHATEFGWRTWWLTHETSILRHSKTSVAKRYGARYMMRPEFLLNFLALAPSAAQVRQTYQKIFPTMLGIRLAKRTDPDVLQKMIQDVQSIEKLEEGRRTVAIAQLADKLKSDFEKQYVAEFKRV
jgi:hypothetical protein